MSEVDSEVDLERIFRAATRRLEPVATIPCADLARSERFYTALLNSFFYEEPDGSRFASMRRGRVCLRPTEHPFDVHDSLRGYEIFLEDPDAALERLESASFTIAICEELTAIDPDGRRLKLRSLSELPPLPDPVSDVVNAPN